MLEEKRKKGEEEVLHYVVQDTFLVATLSH